MKSEPEEFSIQALSDLPNQTGRWDGVRNVQARNIIRTMKLGNHVYFYHSNAKKLSGIYGIMEIVQEAYPDPTSVDPSHKYYDPKCKDITKWSAVDVKLVEIWKSPVLLSEIKSCSAGSPIANMMLLKNSRLSVQEVKREEDEFIFKMIST